MSKLLVLAALVAPAAPATAQWFGYETDKLVASDPGGGDGFGSSVTVDRETSAVGAPYDFTASGPNSGSVYVSRLQGTQWVEEAKLIAPAGAAYELFGYSVALSGDTLLVGAPFASYLGASGAAHVFVRGASGWTHEATFGSDVPEPVLFGWAVALDGDTAVVGAHQDSSGGAVQTGAVHVFVRGPSGWQPEAKLTGSGFSTRMGYSVSAQGDTIVAGAPYAQVAGLSAGAAYVFTRTSGAWTLRQVIDDPQPAQSNLFGWSVSVSESAALVGAPGVVVSGNNHSGSAYVFARNGSVWREQQAFRPDPGEVVGLGRAVSLSGGLAAVGAPTTHYPGAMFAGAVRLYVRDGTAWVAQPAVKASDATHNIGLGKAVSATQHMLVAGAEGSNVSGLPYAGAAYAFEPLGLASATPYCTPGTSSSGCRALVSAWGAPSATAPEGFVLSAHGVEGGANAAFFLGASGKQANPWGNGTSFQCVVPPISRAGVLLGSGAPGTCAGFPSQDLNALWCPTCPRPALNPGAGTVMQAQLWYRDPLNTSNRTTGLSDALEFPVGP